MKANTVKKSNKITIILAVLLSLMVVALITVVLRLLLPDSKEEPIDQTSTVVTIPTITIETPYCNLKYPEKWKNQMVVKSSTEDGLFSEIFYAVIGENEYKLYTIYFGNSLNGNLFGYLPHDGENVPVYIECHTLEENILLQEELMLFYSMMEGINEVSQSIAATEGFYKP